MSLLASAALLRAHVLVVELPGLPVLRLRGEAAVRARGWLVVTDPADADLLLVCGTPGAEAAEAVDALWWAVPAPRARRTVSAAADLPEALDSAARVLADGALQRRAAADAGAAPAEPMADRYGPFRPDWPGGLVIDWASAPDGRIAAAGVRRLAASGEDEVLPQRAFVLAVADAARLLRLTGWTAVSLRLDGIVDLALADTAPERLRGRLRAVRRRIRRSATLRWSLDGQAPDVDVRARLLDLLGAALDGAEPPRARRVLLGRRPAVVPMLVAATEPIRADA